MRPNKNVTRQIVNGETLFSAVDKLNALRQITRKVARRNFPKSHEFRVEKRQFIFCVCRQVTLDRAAHEKMNKICKNGGKILLYEKGTRVIKYLRQVEASEKIGANFYILYRFAREA
jgi:Zn/Cd-binding protein ZinT